MTEQSVADERLRAGPAAARLLALARQDIAEGRPAAAQRVLEMLIARYPDSPVTGDARRELFALYAGDSRVATTRQPPRRGPTDSGSDGAGTGMTVEKPPAPVTTTTQRSVAGKGWQTSVVSFRRLQDELRNTVGDRIFFSAGSAEIGSRARAVITAQAEWLKQRPDIQVVIEGHADDTMAGADDEGLSGRRAAAVRARLLAAGVEDSRIREEAHGARDKVADCSDSNCAAQNRRAVMVVGVRESSLHGNNAPVTAGARDGTPDLRR